jgi:hypothetical protein
VTTFVDEGFSGWSIDGENSWDEEFNVEKCGCEGEAPQAHQWTFDQLLKFEVAVKDLQEEVNKWFRENKVVGRWWLDKAYDDIYEVFGQWASHLNIQRRNYIRLGGVKFHALLGGSLEDLLKNVVGQVRARLQLRIQEGRQFLVWQRNSGVYQSQINALIGYKPRFHLRYNLIFGNSWRYHQNVRFGAFLAGLHRQAWAFYQPRSGVLGWWWKSYRQFVNEAHAQHSRLAGIWFSGIKTRGFGWFRRVGLRKWNAAFIRLQVRFGELHAHLLRKSHAAFGLNFKVGYEARHIQHFQNFFVKLHANWNKFGLRLFNRLNLHFNKYWKLRLHKVHIKPPVIQVQPPRHCGFLGRLFRQC